MSTIGDSQGVSSVQQFRGQKRIIEVASSEFGPRERQLLDNILHELNANIFWIVVKQSDLNHGEILAMAK